MSTLSASPAEAAAATGATSPAAGDLPPRPDAAAAPAAASGRGTLVWDLPVRVAHWSMVLCFAGAWLTAEREAWRLVHVSLGYGLAVLVAFRVVWGLVGSRHARFSSFVRGPRAVLAYLRSLLRGRPAHHTGHNPAGAWAILGLLGLGALLTASGWLTYQDWGGHAVEELHEGLANAMLALVGVHVAGVVISSRLHGENLVKAMVTGRKPVPASEGIRRSGWWVALLLVAALAGLGVWQWQQAPGGTMAGGTGAHASAGHAAAGSHDDDDD